MYGVTGRMGINQHLVRSIVAIRQQGGVALPNGDRVMPDPIPVGRNAEKVAALAREYGIERFTTDLDAALKNPGDEVFFDAATTQMRADLLTRFYKTGVVFLAWLNGLQDHFIMVGAQESAPSLLHLAELFRLADKARVLHDPDLAASRMTKLLATHGLA
jgi:hypothetical protein